MNVLRNAGFNFAGALLPAVALFATLPLVLKGLGPAGYGSLVLVTAIVGYAALLDVNASAGVVQVVAAHHARGQAEAARSAAGLGLAIHLGVGLLGAGLLLVLAGPLVRQLFGVPDAQQAELTLAVRVAAAGFLLGQVQQVLQGVPQASTCRVASTPCSAHWCRWSPWWWCWQAEAWWPSCWPARP